MTEAEALRKVADAALALLLAIRDATPHVNGVRAQSFKMFVTKLFLPWAEEIELAARRAEQNELEVIPEGEVE